MWLVMILALAMPVSIACWLVTLVYTTVNGGAHCITPWRWLVATVAPIMIARYGLKKGSLDKSGAIAGLIVGFVLTISSLCFFACLLTFFILGSRATKYKSSAKKKFEDNFKEGGQRNWIQVLCNGGIAAQFAVLYMLDSGCTEKVVDFQAWYTPSFFSMAVLGALACSCGDTFASEIGTVFSINTVPRLITSFRIVPKGTNGGITFIGTLSSAMGGAIVGVAYYLTLLMCTSDFQLQKSPAQWLIVLTGALAGLLGSTIDSYLGALFQYSGFHRKKNCIVEHPGPDVEFISGSDVLDNHSVNLLSSLLTGLLTPKIAFYLWQSVM
ncbi:Transmembrane protein 19 [Mizuhopecten yessoensis]|uniref:Transmembrane protein 19 n=2 Tax=Mizuhopecten yessoensis TaxID=6573 RepID=A0A210PVI8_MIZYE|nr:Transmembrane protein 19 [Mizuhopecten yessoensis]